VKYVAFAAVMQSVAPAVTRRSSLFSRVVDQMIERHKQEASEGGNANPGTAEPVKRTTNIIYQTLVPAFMVLFAFFLVNIMASSFIGERDRGTLRRMQATRVTPVQLLTGKTLPFLLVSVVQSVLLFLSGKLMFGMSWGTHPAMLLPVILTTSFAATGLGLLVATFVRTESQVSSYSTFLVVVLAGISGCYMPRDWLPEIMKNISLATPHAWALIGYQELLTREQPNLQLVAKCCGILTAMGGACFAFGCVRFRRFEYPV
jgi:ABC-2 type transport system permease protein